MTLLGLLLLAGALIYAVPTLFLWAMQDRLIFPTARVRPPAYPLPPETERLVLVGETGERLVGNLVPALGPSRGLLLGFQGNAWNADDFTRFLALRARDFDIAAFHYRGFRPSEGRPSEAALCADARLIHDHLVARLRPSRVIVGGFSIGSAVAASLAAQRRLDGLVFFTPFDSMLALALGRHRWLPVQAFLRHPFRSDRRVRGLDVPAAVVLAARDVITPAARGAAFVRALLRPVLVETVPDSTHAGIYHLPAVDPALRRALETVVAAGGPGLAPARTTPQKPPQPVLMNEPAQGP